MHLTHDYINEILNILKLMYYKYNSLHLTGGDVGYILQNNHAVGQMVEYLMTRQWNHWASASVLHESL